jgi:hypothetical protein
MFLENGKIEMQKNGKIEKIENFTHKHKHSVVFLLHQIDGWMEWIE